MFSFQLGPLRAVAITPSVTGEQRRTILGALDREQRFALVDLAPTAQVGALIDELTAAGHHLIRYLDHHVDVRMHDELALLLRLRTQFGSAVHDISRGAAPACALLVEPAEWRTRQIRVVFFDSDADGLLSLVRGAGVDYPGLAGDARIIESGGRREQLSAFGALLMRAPHLFPHPAIDPEGHRREMARVYTALAYWVWRFGPVNDPAMNKLGWLGEEIAEAAVQAENTAEGLFWSPETQRESEDVAVIDVRQVYEEGQPFSFPHWRFLVTQHFGTVLTVVRTPDYGDSYVVQRPRQWQDVDLRQYLPPDVRGHTAFRVLVPANRWPEFLANWQRQGSHELARANRAS